MVAFLVLLQNKKFMVFREEWIEHPILEMQSKVFFSPVHDSVADFTLQSKYFFNDDETCCYMAHICKKFCDEREAGNYLTERNPRASSWLKRLRTYSNVPEIVEQVEISSESSDDDTMQNNKENIEPNQSVFVETVNMQHATPPQKMAKNTIAEVQQPTISAVLAKNNQKPYTSADSSDGMIIKVSQGSTKADVEGDDTSTITQLFVPEISIQNDKPNISSQSIQVSNLNGPSAGTSKVLNQVLTGSQEPPKLKTDGMDRDETFKRLILIAKPPQKIVPTTISAVLAKNKQKPSKSADSSDGMNIKVSQGSTKADVEGDYTSTITQLVVPEISIQNDKPNILSQSNQVSNLNEPSAGTSKVLNQVSTGSQEPPKLKTNGMDRVETFKRRILIAKPPQKMIPTTISAFLAKSRQKLSMFPGSSDGMNTKVSQGSTKANVEGADNSMIEVRRTYMTDEGCHQKSSHWESSRDSDAGNANSSILMRRSYLPAQKK